MQLTLEQVRHVARLARLELSPEEEEAYRHQLSAILDAVETLRSLNTDDIEPTSHALLEPAPPREDVVRPSMDAEAALKGAPARVGTSFAVHKIIE